MDLRSQLARSHRLGLYRRRTVVDSPQSIWIETGSSRLLAFCSNDYLGLANHPAVIEAFQKGAQRYGVGSGASHLISGHSRAHHILEEELADFVGSERTLLFSTGYMANLGVVSALADRHTIIFEDRLNHASLIDAARLARARVRRFPHVAMDRLRDLLRTVTGPAILTTDGVFSMDGDLAPLPDLMDLAANRDARLLVDDAHGVGVLGAQGRGSFEHWNQPIRTPAMLMGTLGKALGTFGAFVAAEADLIEALIQYARTYTYTTALPPAVAEATRAALRIVRTEPERRLHLQALVRRFRHGAEALGLKLSSSQTPIQPVILGSTERAVAASASLRDRGILVPAIRTPTVPAGSERLRVTFSAMHENVHVDQLLEALAALPAER